MANLKQTAQDVERRAKSKLARGTVDVALPLYGGDYAARFGVLDGERLAEVETLGDGGDYTPEQALEAGAELIADACRVILGRPEAGKPHEPLEHDDGRPVRFDEDFGKALELELPNGRPLDSMAAVVLAVFTVEDGDALRVNSSALNSFAIRLIEWMVDTRQKVEGELAGGSQATRQ